MTRARWLFVALVWPVGSVADSMLVPTVELVEREPAVYVLRTALVPIAAASARTPQPPPRCVIVDRERTVEEGVVRIHYVVDCRGEPLIPEDVIVLPWAVDGIELLTEWADGTRRRALVGREAAGVVIRLALVIEPRQRFQDQLARYGALGWSHFWSSGSHWVFALALAFIGAPRRALMGVAVGHAVALVLAELGIRLALGPADATLAGAAGLFAAGAVRGKSVENPVLGGALVGLLHGLGMASELAVPGVAPVSALFITNVTLDGLAWMTALAAWKLIAKRGGTPALATVGVLGLFFTFVHLRASLSPQRAGAASLSPINVNVPPSAAPQPSVTGSVMTAPFAAFLIVEPYQVRHEILMEVGALRPWLEPEVSSVLEDARRLVVEMCPIEIDGTAVEPQSLRADFVSLGPGGATVRDAPSPEALESAIIGVTLVYETDALADAVTLAWGLGAPTPLTVTDPRNVSDVVLTEEAPSFEWANTLDAFEPPAIEPVTATRPRVPAFSMLLGVAAAAVFWRTRRLATAPMALLLVAYVAYPWARVEASFGTTAMDRDDATEVIESLLTNVYRCFDIHNEELIYDRLALSVTGEQLLNVYLESRRALELEDRGGARVRIDDVVVRDVSDIRRIDGGGYEIDASWSVGGSVNHFGHIHFRQNRYDATITVVPIESTWKIEAMVMTEERREL